MERFWKKVNKTDTCWLWTASVDSSGYGLFKSNRKLTKAHRFLWIKVNGGIPKEMCLCHTCDTPRCVNPDHLFLGTRADNNKDRDIKGRHKALKGSDHGNSTLKEADIIIIRKLYQEKSLSYAKLARMFSVHRSTIGKIVMKKLWRHV